MGPRRTADLLSLNAHCDCVHLDPRELRHAVASAASTPQSAQALAAALEARSNLLAQTAVFLDAAQWRSLCDAVATLEDWLWRDEVLNAIPVSQTESFGPRPAPGTGLMRAYDFHLTADGPRLIEINTNAGGGFVALALQEALTAGVLKPADAGCPIGTPFPLQAARATLLRSFAAEWRAGPGRSGRPLQDIAIVDEQPAREFLYPDMLLAASALREAGYRARISPVERLRVTRDGGLADEQGKIDLIYNRLTDFELRADRSTPLRRALEGEHTLISPAPWHHRIYAHKLQLAALTQAWRANPETLPFIAPAEAVRPEHAASLWSRRKRLYFKPVAGYGSKAVYAGRKLTRNTWTQLVQPPSEEPRNGTRNASYIAQAEVPAPRRRIAPHPQGMRYDLRVFAADGEAIFACARLFRGQTTNFQQLGGGLAAVLAAPC